MWERIRARKKMLARRNQTATSAKGRTEMLQASMVMPESCEKNLSALICMLHVPGKH